MTPAVVVQSMPDIPAKTSELTEKSKAPASAECLMGRAGCRERRLGHSAADSCELPCWMLVGRSGGCRTSRPTRQVESTKSEDGGIFMISQDEEELELEEEDVRATILLWTVIGAGVLRIAQWGWMISRMVATRCGSRPAQPPRPPEASNIAATGARPVTTTTTTTPERRALRQRAMTPFRVGRQTPYTCECGFRLEAREVTSETSPHFGRLYVSCQRSRADPRRCTYFRWL